MADLFNVGTSALLAFKQAISTTGNNIANASTEGYSRQISTLESRVGQLSGENYFGGGVTLQSVERAYDQFLGASLRTQTSAEASSDSFYQIAVRVDGMLADSGQGIDEAMNSFFNAWQSLGNNPSGRAERTTLLADAETMVNRFSSLSEGLSDITNEVDLRIESGIEEVNRLAESIAQLNSKIISASSSGVGGPNILLDQRDLAISNLAQLVGVSVTEQGDGSVNVSVGKGQALVVGQEFNQLETRRDEFRPDLVEIGYAGSSGAISSLLDGGQLGGLLDVREQLIEPARQQLGLLAAGLSTLVNDQQGQGLDLNGQLGGDFFSSLSLSAIASSQNSGSAEISVAPATVADLTLSAVVFSYDGSDWSMFDENTGTTNTVTFPLEYEGLELSLSGAAVAGDRFRLEPYANAISTFDVAITDPDQIAAAGSLAAIGGAQNLGGMQIIDLEATNIGIVPLSASVDLTYDENALGAGIPGFFVTGAITATVAYDAINQTINLVDMELQFSGEPVQGDSFEIVSSGVSGDNRNALAMASLSQGANLLGGSVSPTGLYGDMVSDVANLTRQSELNHETASAMLLQSQTSQASVSGVNLDEEAARLVQLQQAYQAAAQMVTVADDLFQSLLNAIAR